MVFYLHYSNIINGKDVLKNSIQSNSILYVHPSVMKTHQISKDDSVLIQTIEGQLLLKCWPNSTLQPSCASFQSSFFKRYVGSPIAVQRFQGFVSAASEIYLYPEEYKNYMSSSHFQSFLEKELCDVYVTSDLTIHITYMGFPSYLTIKKITANMVPEANIISEESILEQKAKRQMEEMCCKLKELVLDDSVKEKSLDSSLNSSMFSQDMQVFQTSTPISSRKSVTKKASSMLQYGGKGEDCQEIFLNKQFHYIHPKTKVVLRRNYKKLSEQIYLKDIVGLSDQIEEIKSSIASLLKPGCESISVFSKGLLLVGSSGTGKSMIGEAIRQEYDIPVYILKNFEIERSEDKNDKLKKLFKDADICSPSIIFLDDFDKLFVKDKTVNSVQKEEDFHRNISSLIYTALNYSSILVIATVQNKNLLPSHLRKNGFFTKELDLSISSVAQRKQILKKILEKYGHQLTGEEMYEIARIANGFTGGELLLLCKKAEESDMQNGKSKCVITFHNLKKSLEFIKPAAYFELNFDAPNVKWSDIGGMKKIKSAITEMVEWPLRLTHQFSKFKITPSRGILMYGPPGCCKTMIAKALVTESKFNFISVKGSELFNKYVGESEKSVSKLFSKARSSELPCVLFFDELDSISSTRGSTSGNSDVSNRVLTQLLVEIDGIDVLKGVCILAATNRPDIIDPSFLRPGRFDHIIYVPLPDFETRQEIFKVKTQKIPVSLDVDLFYLARITEGYSGAEIADICREASKFAIKENLTSINSVVSMAHFVKALQLVSPKTSEEMNIFFENYGK